MPYTPVRNANSRLFMGPTPGAAATLEVKGITGIDEIAQGSDMIDVTTLNDTSRSFIKGLGTEKNVQLSGVWSNQDAGQLKMRQAGMVTDRGKYLFKVEIDDQIATSKTRWDFTASVVDFKVQVGQTNGVHNFSSMLRIDGEPVETPAT